MNEFSIRYRRVMTIDNPPDEGGGSAEEEEKSGDDVPDEAAEESNAGVDAILAAIADVAEKVESLSDRMDAFVDAGATVRETDDGADEVAEDDSDVDAEDLETAIEDMDFGLDDDEDKD